VIMSFNVSDVAMASLFGFQQHTLDVMRMLVISGVSQTDVTGLTTRYVGADAVTEYCRTLSEIPIKPRGSSDKSVAQAFRASYHGQFRVDYLRYLLQLRNVPIGELELYPAGIMDDAVESGQLCILDTDSDVVPGTVAGEKGLCLKCSCIVRLDGHDLRCRPVTSYSTDSDNKLAWIGDALHTLDVRLNLLAASVPSTNLQLSAESYLSASSQSAYLTSIGKELPGYVSTHGRSTVFETLYTGEFRDAYLVWFRRQLSVTEASYRDFMVSRFGRFVLSYCHDFVSKFY